MNRFLTVREEVSLQHAWASLQVGKLAHDERLRIVSLGMFTQLVRAGRSAKRAQAHSLGQQVHAQAYTLAYRRWLCALLPAWWQAFLLIMLFMNPIKPSYQDLRKCHDSPTISPDIGKRREYFSFAALRL